MKREPKRRGRPPGSKNRPKTAAESTAPLEWVTLAEAYERRPRAMFPPPRYLIKCDQQRGEVVIYDQGASEGAAIRIPVARLLKRGEVVFGGLIDQRGHPRPIYGEA